MIDELQVKNLALIKDVSLEFSPHMTVLTGETGAGKTALLTALKLIVGERADSHFVRQGTEALELSARLYLSDNPEYEECIATRKVNKDGRSKCQLNGSMASVGQLADIVGSEIDLCGQHEHQKLLAAHHHAEFFDAWIGLEARHSQESYTQAYEAYKQACKQLNQALEEETQLEEKLEDARRYLQEFQALQLSDVQELQELEQNLPRYEYAESLQEYSESAYQALCAEDAALDMLSSCDDELSQALSYDERLQPIYDSLNDAKVLLEDVAQELRRYKHSVEFDPYELDRMRARMDEIKAFLKRYGPRMEDVFARYEQASQLLVLCEDTEDYLQGLRDGLERACKAFEQESVAYLELRRKYAEKFCSEIVLLFAELEMPHASLSLDIQLLDVEKRSSKTPIELEFLFQPAPNMTAYPLVRIASGGEISRVMLAIKCVLGEADGVSTLVFDEIDSGVGGQAATAIARVLSRLAENHQVIVVTHLAQIAACADRHYLVQKQQANDGMMQSYLCELESSERVSELARMLSGDNSELALAHAQQLLDHASSFKRY